MKLLTDYILSDSWQEEKLGIKAGDHFRVVASIGKLTTGSEVTYVGYDDVDNHYGIFVFKNELNEPQEIGRDFCNLGDEFIASFHSSLQRLN